MSDSSTEVTQFELEADSPAESLTQGRPRPHVLSRTHNPLPPGSVVQEYVIEDLVGEGGFGIVYLARDIQLGRTVALKEYMPAALSMRSVDGLVTLRSERDRETFELGRRSFVNEAQMLAAFDQPSLVKVYRFWEQNGTAYMVMPFYEGPTFKQWLTQHGAPSEAWLRALIYPLISALDVMHRQRCYHRDIAPDNILLLTQPDNPEGPLLSPRPLLLDFGAARRVIGDSSQTLTVIFKPGYAPIEQYAETTLMKQGPWTDVYALCAVLYASITGKPPQASAARVMTDEMVPAVQAGEGRYSRAFLSAIDFGMAIRPEHRPQNMAALKALFDGVWGGKPAPPPLPPKPQPKLQPPAAPAFVPPQPAVVAAPAQAPLRSGYLHAQPVPMVSLRPPKPSSQGGRYLAWSASALVTSAFVAGVVWWLPGGGLAPAPSELPQPDPVASSALPASAPVVAPASASVPVLTVLQDMVAKADPNMVVRALPEKPVITMGRDRLVLHVKTSEPGYLYVFQTTPNSSRLHLLFPNAVDKNNQINAQQELIVPSRGVHLPVNSVAGTHQLVVLASKVPRHFSSLGFLDKNDEVPEFDLLQAQPVWAARGVHSNPFVGQIQCAEPTQPCDGAYGATLVEVVEVERDIRKAKRVKRPAKSASAEAADIDADTDVGTNTGNPADAIPDPDTPIRTHITTVSPPVVNPEP